jgi:hypothetical protein
MAGSTEIDVLQREHQAAPDKVNEMDHVQIEQMESGGFAGKDNADFNRVDDEVAKYASDVNIVIDPATSNRLRKMIDRRVLVIMILTYFLQALDKGTMSFASIMGIQADTHLHGQQASLYLVYKDERLISI